MIFQSMYNPIRAQAVPESVQHPDGSVQLPPVEYPQPGFFDGMGDTWKSVVHGAYTGASSLITAASSIPLESLTTRPEVSDWVRRQREEVMPENAREIRRIAKDEYELDPRTSGMAAQIVFGLGDVLPKAALYGTAGPSAGSLLLGADLGIQRANELMDQGVDENTATSAGVLSFAAGAIGMRLPAAFQTATRLRSAAIGAGANVGLSAAEVMGIHWALENQDYSFIAQKYELNSVDAVVSGVLGGAFGAAFWSPTAGVRFQQQRKALSDRFASELEKTKRFTPEQVTAQANLNAAVVTSAAARWGLTPEQVSEVAPRVQVDSAPDADAFGQIIGDVGAENLRASGADIEYRSVAESMMAQGKSPQAIRLATGWELGVDGKWRYEIPDMQLKDGWQSFIDKERVRITEEFERRQNQAKDDDEFMSLESEMQEALSHVYATSKLSDIVDAPELFTAYPQLADFNVAVRRADENVGGWFEPGNNRIVVSLGSSVIPGEFRSVLAHEVQHAIQIIEGFSTGADPARVVPKGIAVYQDAERIRTLQATPEYREWLEVNDMIFQETNPDRVRELLARSEELGRTEVLQEIQKESERLREKWGYNEDVQRVINGGVSGPRSPEMQRLNNDEAYRIRQYRRAAGEVESRNVESRLRLSDEERRAKTLAETEDVPRSEQLNQVYDQKVVGAFSPSQNRITLTPNANITTFSHEVGHWYLHNIMLASQIDGVAESVRKDVEVLLRSFGIESVEAWNALGIEGQRKYHERFAAWVEQYLSTGKAPTSILAPIFRRFAEWIKELFSGTQASAQDAISARYWGEFHESLPPLSPEVRKVLDRMYQDDFGTSGRKPTKTEVAAARAMQVAENDRRRKTALVEDSQADAPDIYDKVSNAQRKAAQDINAGRPVDVSQEVQGVPFSDQRIGAAKRQVAREVFTGDGSTSVVLQNRDRSTVVSVGQMMSIAKNPIYGLLGFDRKTSSGAPLVSFGDLPPDAQLGISDFVVDDTGDQVPVVYAVVEADSIVTSNRIDGSQISDYGDPSKINVVAGNGRMTALQESYRRGQADGYRKAMTADRMHGVDPAVIEQMKAPVLVRIMPQEKVTTGFVKRSNADQVMARSPVEIALEDAPKIRENISTYRFDESGKPTDETVRQFAIDIGETNALARMFNSRGEVTPEAERRILAATFQEAYRNETLTELFTSVTDPGIKRILNAMSVAAPRVVAIRNATQAAIDLAPGMVDAANAVAQARLKKATLEEIVSQLGMFDSPTSGPFIDLFGRNANSAVGISRVLLPLADWIDQRLSTRGSLFGDEQTVDVDVAGVLGEMRRLENAQRKEAGLDPLPEVDEDAIRRGVRSDIESIQRALRQSAERAETPAAEPRPDAASPVSEEPPAAARQAIPEQPAPEQQASGQAAQDPIDREFSLALDDSPDQAFFIEDEDGTLVSMTPEEIDAHARSIEEDARKQSEGIVEAGLCIIQNQGIQ